MKIALGFPWDFWKHTSKYMGKSSLLGTDQQWLQSFLWHLSARYQKLLHVTTGFMALKACLNEEMSNYKFIVSEMKGPAGGKSRISKSY